MTLADLLDREDRACLGADSETFFPLHMAAAGEAKNVCRPCPVRDGCLDYALDSQQQFGVWGGMTPEERDAEKRRRNKAARVAASQMLVRQQVELATKLYHSGMSVEAIAAQMRIAPRAVARWLGGMQ